MSRLERQVKKDPLRIADISSKDPKVFEPVYRRVMPLMEGAARRIVSADTAPDVAHDALMKVIKQAESGDIHEESLEAYCTIAAKRKALDVVKREARGKELLGGKPVEFDVADSKETNGLFANSGNEEMAEQAEVELFRRVQEVVQDEKFVAPLYLAYKDFSYEEIAAITDTAIGTVRSRIYRGKERIKKEIDFVIGGEVTDIPERLAYAEEKKLKLKKKRGKE